MDTPITAALKQMDSCSLHLSLDITGHRALMDRTAAAARQQLRDGLDNTRADFVETPVYRRWAELQEQYAAASRRVEELTATVQDQDALTAAITAALAEGKDPTDLETAAKAADLDLAIWQRRSTALLGLATDARQAASAELDRLIRAAVHQAKTDGAAQQAAALAGVAEGVAPRLADLKAGQMLAEESALLIQPAELARYLTLPDTQ